MLCVRLLVARRATVGVEGEMVEAALAREGELGVS